MAGPGRMLVARVGALGDTLMATPVVTALAEQHPGEEIDFLASAAAAPLLKMQPQVARVFGLRQRNWPFLLSPEKILLCRRLRQRQYRFAVLLEEAPRYRHLLARAGLTEPRSFRETPFQPERHSIVNNLAAALGHWEGPPPGPQLPISSEASFRAATLLEGLRSPVIGLHLGYGPAGKKVDQAQRLKGWPLSSFGRLASLLLAQGCSVVLTGSPQDRVAAAQVEALARGPANRVRNLAGATGVQQLAALISRFPLLVSVDSGPAHIAAAVGTAVIVLWGPAKLQQVSPVSSRSPVVILREPVPCAPCYDTPAMKTCRQNICMQRITPQSVVREVSRLLS